MSLELRRRLMGVKERASIVLFFEKDSTTLNIAGEDVIVKTTFNGIQKATKYDGIVAGNVTIEHDANSQVTILAKSLSSILYSSGGSAISAVVNNMKSLTNLNLEKNTSLENIYIRNCPVLNTLDLNHCGSVNSGNLTVVRIENCPLIKNVNVSYNGSLSGLDLIDSTENIEVLNVNFTKVSKIDSINMPNLQEFSCAGTKVAEINTFNCPKLKKLSLGYGTYSSNITSLNLTNNTLLEELNYSPNSYDGKLSTLDLSNNVNLKILAISGVMESLDLRNLSLLTSVSVTGSSLREILFGNTNRITSLGIKGKKITNIDIPDMSNITSLDLGCGISELDISSATKLTSLSVSSSVNLQFVNTDYNTKLTGINIYNSDINRLDLKNNTKLTSLNVVASNVTELNLTQCTQLTKIECNDSKLKKLDVSENPLFTTFSMFRNPLSDIRCKLTNSTFVSNLITQLTQYGLGRAGTIYTDDDYSTISDVCASVGWEIKSLSEAPNN